MDAALTIALDQIVHSAGSWNSFAGILGLVYVDGETGATHALHAGYRVPAAETDALTIPETGTPSGRTALVPGFMAGVEAAHARFGRVPFSRLFAPAIRDAEEGIVLSSTVATVIRQREDVLSRLPETRDVFLVDGVLPRSGERFRQPALAATLRAVANQGASYMYTGEWAERFVAQVQAEGGALAASDLADYEAVWADPLCFAYHDNRICTLGAPDVGGVALAESLLVAEAADVRGRGSYLESSDALYWLLRSQQLGLWMVYLPQLLPESPTFFTDRLEGVEASFDARLTRAQAEAVVGHVESGRFDRVLTEWSDAYEEFEARSHSDGIVVVDAEGNYVAMTHTINTSRFGTTGINVGGVSIPDSAAFQRGAVYLAGPGEPLPMILNPAIVSRDGAVRLVATTIGNPHYAMVSHLHGILDLGLDAAEMVDTPILDGDSPFQEFIRPGALAPGVLEEVRARGLPLREEAGIPRSFWLGISLGADGRTAGVTPSLSLVGGGVYPADDG